MFDFLNGTNKWSYCQYLWGYGFPGRCGPRYSEWYQSSEFQPTCPTSYYSYRDEVYWFLYDEGSSGEAYHPEWSPSETSSGLPFLFASVQDIELQHVVVSGAGADSEYSLFLKRSSAVPFKHISILGGRGNGLKVSKESYHFDNLTIKSDISSSGNGINIVEGGKVKIDGYHISTKHSGNAIYVDRYSSLSLLNGEIIPKSSTQYAVYGYYADSIFIENFVYEYTMGNAQYREPIRTNRLENTFALKDSFLNCSSLSSYRYAVELSSYGSTRSTSIRNVSFVADDNSRSFGGYFRTNQGSGDVTFESNFMFGGNLYYDAVSISGDTVLVKGNSLSNLTTNSNLIYISVGSNGTSTENEIHHVICDYSIIKMQGSAISFTENKLVNVEGNTAIEINNVDQPHITRNSLIKPNVDYYIKTDTSFDSANNAIVIVEANYWSTTSFEDLNKGTYDSFYDSSLIRYAMHSKNFVHAYIFHGTVTHFCYLYIYLI